MGSQYGGIRRQLILLVTFVCVVSSQHAARAQFPLMANDRAGNLYEVNPTTGAATFRVATGLNDLLGITLSFDGITFGLTGSGNPAGAALYRIDPGNGSSVLIGPLGMAVAEGDLVRRAPISGVTTHLYAVGVPIAGGAVRAACASRADDGLGPVAPAVAVRLPPPSPWTVLNWRERTTGVLHDPHRSALSREEFFHSWI